jgi:hypothetical protein
MTLLGLGLRMTLLGLRLELGGGSGSGRASVACDACNGRGGCCWTCWRAAGSRFRHAPTAGVLTLSHPSALLLH